MNLQLVAELSKLICLNHNPAIPRIRHNDIKRTINGLLNRKSNTTVIKELSILTQSIKEQNKNKTILIVVLALIRRNLDCVDELSKLLVKYNLINPLFGGLKLLLSGGKSKTFTFQVKWSDDLFKNKYEWLERFKGEFHYWEFIELFQAIKIVHLVNPTNIEKLAKEDKTKLILLNMLTRSLNITPTDELIEWLLNDSDELNQNIGLAFITSKVSFAVSEILNYKRTNSHFGEEYNKQQRKIYIGNLKLLKCELPKIELFFGKCDDKTKVSLLVNYILSQREGHPSIFARWLIEADNQEHLISEIKNNGKLRTLRDILVLLSAISKTRRSKGETTNASKLPLYNAIVDTLIAFVKIRSSLYKWEEQEQNEFLDICAMLPKQSKKKLSRFLRQELETLAVSDIDRLLRYKIYLEDERKLQIINGMLNILNG